jgi:AraC family transcriptional regulator of adaptative response/methylated-DNA-[protein]-cysteine methyltransferase
MGPNYKQMTSDYHVVERAIAYLEQNYQDQPSLEDVANSVGYSPYHFQRLFSRWVGISPKRFLQFLTKEHAKELLRKSSPILDVAYQTGLSGPSRLHDLFVSCEAVTPGEYKMRGEGLTIDYGYHYSPFGECLIAVTEQGVCSLIFIQNGGHSEAYQVLRNRWEKSNLRNNPAQTASIMEKIFSFYAGPGQTPLHIFLRGTNFQLKVWEALLQIPVGSVVSYQDIARRIGAPGAYRAVGSAVAQNPIPMIIPCHRVIRKMGAFGEYRWGAARKKAILGWEMAKSAA